MPQLYVAVSGIVDSPAGEVYTILADYRHHHPHILPKPYFPKLEIEEGGYGTGTVMQVHTQAFGNRRVYHMRVSEPEPGRVLAETDMETGLETTFTVTPVENQQSEVTIATRWQSQPGINGLIERLVVPFFMKRIYRQELQQLAEYARRNK
jgi:hypothetical protein